MYVGNGHCSSYTQASGSRIMSCFNDNSKQEGQLSQTDRTRLTDVYSAGFCLWRQTVPLS